MLIHPDSQTEWFEHTGFYPDKVVGDRIYTDMMMAHHAGAFGVLVLSGESTLDDAAKVDPGLDLILPSISELGELITLVK